MREWKRAAGALALGIGLVAGAANARAGDSLEGVYQVEGSNPGEATKYKGTAKVAFNGEVFDVVWNLSGQEIKGTGLKLGDTFAVSAQMPDGKPAGIMLFLLRPDGGMTGRWASAGATRTGTEIWVPQATPGATPAPAPAPQ
jgi:hypothetical protein